MPRVAHRATLEANAAMRLICAGADGKLDREVVFQALYWHWAQRYDWWERPAGQMGRRLREAWQAEAQASGLIG